MKKIVLLILISFIFSNNSFSQDFWKGINGPLQGEIISMGINSQGYIFAAVYYGGIFRSTDGGMSWIDITGGLPLFDVRAIAFNSNDHIFIGNYGSIYTSDSNGDSWNLLNDFSIQETDIWVNSIAINTNGDIFIGFVAIDYGGSWGAIMRSIDNGISWTNSYSGSGINSIVFDNTHNLYSGTSNGIIRSTNNGNTWDSLNSGLTNSWVSSLTIDPIGNIFAGTLAGVFRSTDSGNNWVEVNIGLTRFYIQSICSNSFGNIFVGTESGVFRTADSGNSWTEVNNGLLKSYTHSLAINLSNIVYAGTLNGIYKSSDNGEGWLRLNIGFPIGCIQAIGIKGTDIYVEGFGNYKSSDGGINWVELLIDSSSVRSFLFDGSGNIFVQTLENGIYRSNDDGITWLQVNSGLTSLYITAAAIDDNGIFYLSTRNGLYRSTNSGDNWVIKNDGLPNQTASAVATNSTGDVFICYDSEIYRSTDFGNSWVKTGYQYYMGNIDCITIDSNNCIYVSGYNMGIYRSTDNGDNWSQIANLAVTALITNSDNHIYSYNGAEVFESKDAGYTWIQINEGLSNHFIQSLAIDSEGYLFVGTYCGGIYRSVEKTTTIDNLDEIPKLFSLSQNYPNPFNPSTKINWQAPVSGWQTLKVYDVLGREVANLIDEYKNAGSYIVEFDGSNLPTGVYFYQLKAGDYLETKKMILLK